MKSKVFIFAVLLVLLMAAYAPPAQGEPISGTIFFIVGQLINDAKTRPIEHYDVAQNPSFNVWTRNKEFGGANPDAKTIVAAVGKGAIITVDPGENGPVDIVGAELNSNEADFQQVGVFRAKALEIDNRLGRNGKCITVPDDAPPKFLPEIDTLHQSQKLYSVRLTTYFVEKEAHGLFNMGRRDVIKKSETNFKYILLDPEYMAKAASDSKIQASLRYNYGLMAIPASQTAQMQTIPASQPVSVDSGMVPVQTVESGSQTLETKETTNSNQMLEGELKVAGRPGQSYTIKMVELPSGQHHQRTFRLRGYSANHKIEATSMDAVAIRVQVVSGGVADQPAEIRYSRFQVQADITPGKHYLRINSNPVIPGGIDPSTLQPGEELMVAPRDILVTSDSASGQLTTDWIRKNEIVKVKRIRSEVSGEYVYDYFQVIAIGRCGNNVKPLAFGLKSKRCRDKIVEIQQTRVVYWNSQSPIYTMRIDKPDRGSVERETPPPLWNPNLDFSSLSNTQSQDQNQKSIQDFMSFILNYNKNTNTNQQLQINNQQQTTGVTVGGQH